MKLLCTFSILSLMFQNMVLFDFTSESNVSQWQIVDDVVMGGRSNGSFKINSDGHGEFSGEISLKNNGGFSSLRYNFESVKSSTYSKFVIHLKGDGKTYQFRVKDSRYNRHSYVYRFKASTDWQTIEIPFSEMQPSFRGYQLDIPNYGGEKMEEIGFLIGNKKEETFKLLIDKISIQ